MNLETCLNNFTPYCRKCCIITEVMCIDNNNLYYAFR